MQYPLSPILLALALVAGAPALAQTQPAKPAEKAAAPAKPAAKPAGKPALARSAQKAVEEATPIDDDPSVTLTPSDLDVAKQVFVGDIPCELGATVRVRAARRDGIFVVTTKGYRFVMHPVESRTGAIRLEDAKRGAMWLQLGNKSMLMSQKLGQRLADECQSPQQVTMADELKKNPRPSILDAPRPAASAPAADPAAAAPPAGTDPASPPPAAPKTTN
ncbi:MULTISPECIES: hypothetical protein [Ramlibacter]|uniref:Uncharacterized protein n=1 Tax=Ramlibacter pinisoli TaxID=2682844 RepID=A0A6N8IQF6_9BURK|nr:MULTISPECIES: hypothetical protein [Ramlibacter]MBA2964112.1 hypothetical protein [Ramlibacter sp. CGMCC 1.13660]MVQ29078.1 hypothetical protein [Ramlibacter pinisoli]